MNKHLMVLALVFAVGNTATMAAPATGVATVAAAKVEMAKSRMTEDAIRKATEGKSATEARKVVSEQFANDSLIAQGEAATGASKADLLAHVATNPDALGTVRFVINVKGDAKATDLQKRAAIAAGDMLALVSRGSATSAKDQNDIEATRKVMAIAGKAATYSKEAGNDTAVRFVETVARNMKQGSKANEATRSALVSVLQKSPAEVEAFMASSRQLALIKDAAQREAAENKSAVKCTL